MHPEAEAGAGEAIEQRPDVSVMIGTPLIGNPTPGFTRSLWSLVRPERCVWKYVPNRPCDMARNLLVEECLEDGHDWLFMLDGDMCFEPETLLRLNYRKKPLIGALCFTRVMPPAPAAYRGITGYTENGWPRYRVQFEEILEWLERTSVELKLDHPSVILPDQEGALERYDSTGGACLLIHRSVLEAVEPPWFEYTQPDRLVGEDFYFFHKAKEAGFQLWIDRTVIVGHAFGEQYIGAMDYVAFMLAAEYYGLPTWLKLMGRMLRRFGLA